MNRRFVLEHPINDNVIAECGHDERGFTVDVFVEDRLEAAFADNQMVCALEFLVERGFFTEADLKSAHEMIFGGLSLPMPDGAKRAFEAVINFLRVAAD